MVDELQQLWDGIEIKVTRNSYPIKVRAAFIAVVCDIPACRKVCRFTGFQARLGCSKCSKAFLCKMFGEKSDYSGFIRSLWPPRSKAEHMQALKRISAARSPTEQSSLESAYGCRFSELTRLPYFDVIKCHAVDPMHNLY